MPPRPDDIDRRLTRARAAVDAATGPERRVRALSALAQVLADHDAPGALRLADEAAALAAPTGNALLVAEARLARGASLVELTRFEEATLELGAAAETFEREGVATGLGHCLLHLACILDYTDEAPAALQLLDRAESLLVETGDEDGLGRAANERGNAYATLGRVDEAVACYDHAARIFAGLGAHLWQAYLVNNRAWARLQGLGDDPEGVGALLPALIAEIGTVRGADLPSAQRALLLQTEGELRHAAGDYAGAVAVAVESARLGEEVGNVRLAGAALLVSGLARLADGDAAAAIDDLEGAVQRLARVSQADHGLAVGALADALVGTGDLRGAVDAYRAYHDLGSSARRDVARLRGEIVDARLALERTRHAVELERLRLTALADENALLREQQVELRRAARHDALTGLANRRALDEDLRRRSERGDLPLTVALLDVDDFKGVNDEHSHLVGDEVLRVLARLLGEHCREQDVVARYGGEEFAIVLPGVGLAVARRVCERIRVAVLDHDWSRVAPGVAVTVSIGCAEASPAYTPTGLLAAADERLYRAKTGGRNRVVTSG